MSEVHHADLYGLREEKYRALEEMDVASTPWTRVEPKSPWYLFKPFDDSLWGEYGDWWKVNEVFPVNSVGIVTARDKLTIHFTPEEVWETIQDFASLHPEEARRKYKLGKDVQDWSVDEAQKDLKESGLTREKIVPILYRPFDVRFTYYTGRSRGFHCRPRGEVMGHMLAGENMAMVSSRLTKGEVFRHVQVTSNIVEVICMSPNTSNNGFVFPLYLYPTGDLGMETEREANLAPAFVQALEEALGDDAPAFTPEDVFHYIYAVFHSPTYRERYEEFLAIDFPRVPLPGSDSLFRTLARIGQKLVALHLLQETGPELPNYPIPGTNRVETVRYEPPSEDAAERTPGRVWINRQQYFANVPPEAWDFYIGGYRVCEKWLKDRKSRTLSGDELETYRRIVANVRETIRLMAEVDASVATHGGWPGAFRQADGKGR
ncbi:MAG: hypothetical protein KatS3mg015_0955 [Fimbriimonadales bacterium]|nr:MAG: hypothetical protein KatS3mg015_0955 [Fimbriimonadales bacterium]